MAIFVIFFHTGNIQLDTKVHVESLKEYLDGLESSCLFMISHQVQGWPFLIILHTGMLWIYEVPKAWICVKDFLGFYNSHFFTKYFILHK